MDNKVKVNIFGNNYNIEGDATPEYIYKLAEYVNNKMEEVCKNVSTGNPMMVAILTALNMADESFQLKESKADLTTAIEKKANALISMIDEGLIGDVFSNLRA
jgi:cell division protein ZapA